MTDSKNQTVSKSTSHSQTWNAMLTALRFALPYMEDLADSSDNKGEHRAARLMRNAIAKAERE